MKKLCMCFAMLIILCGCGLAQGGTYISVKPHEEEYSVEIDSDVLVVGSYLSLRNAIQAMVEAHAEEGVIRAETYAGNLPEELSRAVDEITNNTPLGAYSVSSMTYDYSQIVSYYEIHININYQRSREEMASIVSVSDTLELREKLLEAMKSYSTVLVAQIGSYESIDLEYEIYEIYQDHPEFALELPKTSMEIYPENGSQKIVEIHMDYTYSEEELTSCRDALDDKISDLQSICNHAESDLICARRIYHRLGRNTVLEQKGIDPLDDSAYGAIINGCATSYGFAQAYKMIAEACGLSCKLVTGWKNGTEHYWCLVELDGEFYYLDPTLMVLGTKTNTFLMGSEELEENGYRFSADEEYPYVILPEEFKDHTGEIESSEQTAEDNNAIETPEDPDKTEYTADAAEIQVPAL